MSHAEHLTPAELARRWKVAESTLAAWRSNGNGPPYLKIHSVILYRESDVLQYESDNARKSSFEKLNPGVSS